MEAAEGDATRQDAAFPVSRSSGDRTAFLSENIGTYLIGLYKTLNGF